MMKNDFDFIKEKIENSGVNAPADMDKEFVLKRIADIQPAAAGAEAEKPQAAPVKVKRRYGRLTAIAAAFVAAAVLTAALTVHFTGKKAVQPFVTTEADQATGLIRFSSYDEVQAAVDQLSSRYNMLSYRGYTNGYKGAVDDAAAVPAESPDGEFALPSSQNGDNTSSGGDKHSDTYKQVDGVDEGDCIKTDGRYIYVVDGIYDDDNYGYTSRVSIFRAAPGETDPILSLIPGEVYIKTPATPDEATPDERIGTVDFDYDKYDIMVSDIYLKDNRMILLCSCYNGWSTAKICALVYDVADMENVRLLDVFTQSGNYTSSRMIGDTLYLVTNEYEVRDIPVCGHGTDPCKLPADCIYSVPDPMQKSFLIVSAYDTRDYTASADSKAVLGLGSDVYCSKNNLYIAAADYSNYYRVYYEVNYAVDDGDVITADGADVTGDTDDGDDDDGFEPIKTKIFKVSLDGGVNFVAYGEVVGTTNNQYSFDEKNGYLRVATTSTGMTDEGDYEEINNLFVLDGGLNVVGSVTGFAPTESIKAVRYVGDTAYVITYEQTDPLFVIDLSAPTAPVILGEVKISGFSTMLVPIDENTILGLGYHTGEVDYTDMEVTDGFKLALFDVSDKSNPQVLDSRSYVNYSSEVMNNPKALTVNGERGDFIVPLNYYRYDDSDYDLDYYDDDEWERWYNSHVERYGAVLNFRVEGGRIVQTDLHVTPYSDVSRCVYVGDTVYATHYNDSGEVRLDSFSYR